MEESIKKTDYSFLHVHHQGTIKMCRMAEMNKCKCACSRRLLKFRFSIKSAQPVKEGSSSHFWAFTERTARAIVWVQIMDFLSPIKDTGFYSQDKIHTCSLLMSFPIVSPSFIKFSAFFKKRHYFMNIWKHKVKRIDLF